MKDIAVVYDGHDRDGFTAAWAAWVSLGDTADYIPMNPGDDLPDGLEGRQVYFLDLCPRADDLLWTLTCNRSVTVIDHHPRVPTETACLDAVKTLAVVYAEDRSAAHLAWDHFHPGQPVPFLVRLVETRDLWTWNLPHCRELDAWLSVQEQTFPRWDFACATLGDPNRWGAPLLQGEAVLARDRQTAQYLAGLARKSVIAGHEVPTVNSPVLRSEIGHLLAQGNPFACVWYEADGKRRCSLRSTPEGLDVGAIAASLGGGGHRHAAAYTVDVGE